MALKNPYNAYNQYKQNDVMLASPEELTLMLYNGAIKYVNRAVIAIDDKNIENAHQSIARAEDIVAELNATLNTEYEVSKGLRSLYEFILERLVDANIQKDKEILEEILPFLTELRDTWKEAMALAKKK
jgi:flagellar protein FliS